MAQIDFRFDFEVKLTFRASVKLGQSSGFVKIQEDTGQKAQNRDIWSP